jgi:hypothetical protein
VQNGKAVKDLGKRIEGEVQMAYARIERVLLTAGVQAQQLQAGT